MKLQKIAAGARAFPSLHFGEKGLGIEVHCGRHCV